MTTLEKQIDSILERYSKNVDIRRLRYDELLSIVRLLECDGAEIRGLLAGIRRTYRRFPPGFIVAFSKGLPIAFLSLGFQRNCFLLGLVSRLTFIQPTVLFNIAIKLRVLKDFEIASIHVAEAYRGKGIANTLMKIALEIGRDVLSQRRIVLMVRDTNERAIAFYRNWGFRIYGELKITKGKKLLMERDLLRGE